MSMTENDLRKLQLSGFYLDTDMNAPMYNDGDDSVQSKINEIDGVTRTGEQEDYTLLECHVELLKVLSIQIVKVNQQG